MKAILCGTSLALSILLLAPPTLAELSRLGDQALSDFAYRLKENGGWMVLDDIRGNFAFEGLTLRVRTVDSGFGGDGEQFNRDVLELGLPNTVRFNDVQFKISASSTARPTDPGFQQTDIFSVDMRGEVVMEGNLLVFPAGNP